MVEVKAKLEKTKASFDGVEEFEEDCYSAVCPFCGTENWVTSPEGSVGGDGDNYECEHFQGFDGEKFYFQE